MNVGGDISDQGTTPKLKISNLADIAKQIVYICVSVPVESHAGRILGLVGQMVSRIRPWAAPYNLSVARYRNLIILGMSAPN